MKCKLDTFNPFCPICQYSDVFSYIKLKISYLGSYNDYKTLTNQNRSLRLYSVSTNQRLLPQLFRVKWNEITMRESCAVLLGFATFFYFHQFLYLKYFFHYFDYKICLINKYSMNIHYSFSILDLYKWDIWYFVNVSLLTFGIQQAFCPRHLGDVWGWMEWYYNLKNNIFFHFRSLRGK